MKKSILILSFLVGSAFAEEWITTNTPVKNKKLIALVTDNVQKEITNEDEGFIWKLNDLEEIIITQIKKEGHEAQILGILVNAETQLYRYGRPTDRYKTYTCELELRKNNGGWVVSDSYCQRAEGYEE
jgi:hypothetical protein